MLLIVFKKSYSDFIIWRAKTFPYQPVDGSILFCMNHHDALRYLSCPKNSLYLSNRELTKDDLYLIKLRALVKIEIPNE